MSVFSDLTPKEQLWLAKLCDQIESIREQYRKDQRDIRDRWKESNTLLKRVRDAAEKTSTPEAAIEYANFNLKWDAEQRALRQLNLKIRKLEDKKYKFYKDKLPVKKQKMPAFFTAEKGPIIPTNIHGWYGKLNGNFEVESGGFSVDWVQKGCGFGGISINVDKNGKFTLNTECMSKDFAKELLCNLVDAAEEKD